MATHSSILAWEIPRPKEPGGLQSTGHKESDKTVTARAYACTFPAALPASYKVLIFG